MTMNHKLNAFFREFAMFERDVRCFSDNLFSRICSSCITPCCKPEICYESIESPFLSHLRKIVPPPASFSEINGWLTESGCMLQTGRPPVCHEFLCNTIIDKQPTAFHKSIITVLSKLITHIGKNALGKRHLVEIMSEDKLQKINLSRIQSRFTDARLAFKEIQGFFEGRRLTSESIINIEKVYTLKESIHFINN